MTLFAICGWALFGGGGLYTARNFVAGGKLGEWLMASGVAVVGAAALIFMP
jgi:hypothetical protein